MQGNYKNEKGGAIAAAFSEIKKKKNAFVILSLLLVFPMILFYTYVLVLSMPRSMRLAKASQAMGVGYVHIYSSKGMMDQDQYRYVSEKHSEHDVYRAFAENGFFKVETKSGESEYFTMLEIPNPGTKVRFAAGRRPQSNFEYMMSKIDAERLYERLGFSSIEGMIGYDGVELRAYDSTQKQILCGITQSGIPSGFVAYREDFYRDSFFRASYNHPLLNSYSSYYSSLVVMLTDSVWKNSKIFSKYDISSISTNPQGKLYLSSPVVEQYSNSSNNGRIISFASVEENANERLWMAAVLLAISIFFVYRSLLGDIKNDIDFTLTEKAKPAKQVFGIYFFKALFHFIIPALIAVITVGLRFLYTNSLLEKGREGIFPLYSISVVNIGILSLLICGVSSVFGLLCARKYKKCAYTQLKPISTVSLA